MLRYLPTNLTAPEIAQELYVSRNTVKTHMRKLYAKLGTHTRTEAVERARVLGLLAPPAHTNADPGAAGRRHLPWSGARGARGARPATARREARRTRSR